MEAGGGEFIREMGRATSALVFALALVATASVLCLVLFADALATAFPLPVLESNAPRDGAATAGGTATTGALRLFEFGVRLADQMDESLGDVRRSSLLLLALVLTGVAAAALTALAAAEERLEVVEGRLEGVKERATRVARAATEMSASVSVVTGLVEGAAKSVAAGAKRSPARDVHAFLPRPHRRRVPQ